MIGKFIVFILLYLSVGSSLLAMSDETTINTPSYAGNYEIRRNKSEEESSGSLIFRQNGHSLVLEKFNLIPGSSEHEYISNLKGTNGKLRKRSNFNQENSRIAKFILSTLPTVAIPLDLLDSFNTEIHYGSHFGEGEEIIDVRFKVAQGIFILSFESPFGMNAEKFRLFKLEN